MPLNVALTAFLLVPPLRPHATVKTVIDPAIKLVDVHCAHPPLKSVPFSLKAGDRLAVVLFFIGTALPESHDNPLEYFIVDPELGEMLGKLLL